MKDLRQYLRDKVGQTWSECDCIWAVGQLDKMDALAQATYNRARQGAEVAR